MTPPILLVGISNCRQWVILIVVEHLILGQTLSGFHDGGLQDLSITYLVTVVCLPGLPLSVAP